MTSRSCAPLRTRVGAEIDSISRRYSPRPSSVRRSEAVDSTIARTAHGIERRAVAISIEADVMAFEIRWRSAATRSRVRMACCSGVSARRYNDAITCPGNAKDCSASVMARDGLGGADPMFTAAGAMRTRWVTRSGRCDATISETRPPIEFPMSSAGPASSDSISSATTVANGPTPWRSIGGDSPKPGKSRLTTRPYRPRPSLTSIQLLCWPPNPWTSTTGVPVPPPSTTWISADGRERYRPRSMIDRVPRTSNAGLTNHLMSKVISS